MEIDDAEVKRSILYWPFYNEPIIIGIFIYSFSVITVPGPLIDLKSLDMTFNHVDGNNINLNSSRIRKHSLFPLKKLQTKGFIGGFVSLLTSGSGKCKLL